LGEDQLPAFWVRIDISLIRSAEGAWGPPKWTRGSGARPLRSGGAIPLPRAGRRRGLGLGRRRRREQPRARPHGHTQAGKQGEGQENPSGIPGNGLQQAPEEGGHGGVVARPLPGQGAEQQGADEQRERDHRLTEAEALEGDAHHGAHPQPRGTEQQRGNPRGSPLQAVEPGLRAALGPDGVLGGRLRPAPGRSQGRGLHAPRRRPRSWRCR